MTTGGNWVKSLQFILVKHCQYPRRKKVQGIVGIAATYVRNCYYNPASLVKTQYDVYKKHGITFTSTFSSANGHYTNHTAWSYSPTRQLSNSRTEKDVHPTQKRILQSLVDIEDRMRYHGYSTIRIGLSLLLATGVGMYAFREYIRENVAEEVSTVATMSLADVSVKMKVQELALALIQTLLTNDNIQQQTVKFIQDIFSKPETQQALVLLLVNVLNDQGAQVKLVSTLKHVLNESLSDENFRKQTAANIRLLLHDENTRAGLVELLQYTLNDDHMYTESRIFLQRILASQQIRTEASILGKNVLHDVVNDQKVQKGAGDALWSAFAYSVTPKVFSGSPPPPTS